MEEDAYARYGNDVPFDNRTVPRLLINALFYTSPPLETQQPESPMMNFFGFKKSKDGKSDSKNSKASSLNDSGSEGGQPVPAKSVQQRREGWEILPAPEVVHVCLAKLTQVSNKGRFRRGNSYSFC